MTTKRSKQVSLFPLLETDFFLHVFVCRLQIMVLEVNTNLTLTLEGYVPFQFATINVLLH